MNMTRQELLALHDVATKARDSAHRAYEVALADRTVDVVGDSNAAWETLQACNRLRDWIYRKVIACTE